MAHPHPARVRVWLGWTLAVATIVLCGAGSHFGDAAHAYLPPLPRAAQQDFRLTPIFAMAFAVVGALIVWRRPRNRIGWVCCGIGILWGLEEFVLDFSSYAAYAPTPSYSRRESLAVAGRLDMDPAGDPHVLFPALPLPQW